METATANMHISMKSVNEMLIKNLVNISNKNYNLQQ